MGTLWTRHAMRPARCAMHVTMNLLSVLCRRRSSTMSSEIRTCVLCGQKSTGTTALRKRRAEELNERLDDKALRTYSGNDWVHPACILSHKLRPVARRRPKSIAYRVTIHNISLFAVLKQRTQEPERVQSVTNTSQLRVALCDGDAAMCIATTKLSHQLV